MTDASFPSSPVPSAEAFRSTLESVRLGEPRHFHSITAFPLFLAVEGGLDYLTLDEAIATTRLRVTEVSPAGSVPELWLSNDSGHSVLLLDGEELVGAKQNRVVNLSLLLPHGFNARIPVSCTEKGRWRHTSVEFSASEVVMELKSRRRKSRSVSESLASGADCQSDQGGVWESIQALQAKAGHHSPTSAMLDIFRSRAALLESALAAFPAVPGQHGLLVFVGGHPAGFDLVSRSAAYARVHAKLVRSYALDALLEAPVSGESAMADPGVAAAFLRAAGQVPLKAHPAIGRGESLRSSRGCSPQGAALVHQGTVFHAAFFGDAAEAGPRSRPGPAADLKAEGGGDEDPGGPW